uniref:Rubisco LSMT substrate-binding domain-containing protein n=1 Tax=Davidia involucrata TaxID=16924 RepID=A0A5B7BJN3_DAVIN
MLLFCWALGLHFLTTFMMRFRFSSTYLIMTTCAQRSWNFCIDIVHQPLKMSMASALLGILSLSSWEVRSSRGKGRGIPQSLRAFVRVLCSTSSQELNDLAMEAAQSDGRLARRPLKNRSREIQAHQFLLSRITQLIEECNASIKSLVASRSPFIFGKLAVRRQMARDLLSGELRVLKSASEWLKNYCATL